MIGANGNIYVQLGIASNVLKKNGMRAESKEMFERATHSKSYNDALAIITEYVNPVTQEEYENQEQNQNYEWEW